MVSLPHQSRGRQARPEHGALDAGAPVRIHGPRPDQPNHRPARDRGNRIQKDHTATLLRHTPTRIPSATTEPTRATGEAHDSEEIDVSILLVSYNTHALTTRCIEAVVAQTVRSEYEVIVVDNASSDGSADRLEKRFADIQLIRSSSNLGFGNAVNLAARSASGRLLLLLNPDTEVIEGAVDRIVAFADAHPEAGIYGGLTLNPDGSRDDMSCWRRPTVFSSLLRGLGVSAAFPRTRWLNPERIYLDVDAGPTEVDIITGCFLLIRHDLWRALDGFDPAFFMYSEDFDLCLRAHRHGARPVALPDAKLIHHGGASERVRADKMIRLFRAKAQLFDRHFGPMGARIARASLALWALTRRIGYRVAALLGRGSHESVTTWDEIWTRRAEYLAADPAALEKGGRA